MSGLEDLFFYPLFNTGSKGKIRTGFCHTRVRNFIEYNMGIIILFIYPL